MTDKEIDDLNIILNELSEYSAIVDINNFQEYQSGNVFGFSETHEKEEYFRKLMLIFEELKLAEVNIRNTTLIPIGTKCIIFKNNGGFKQYFKNIEIEIELKKQNNIKQIKKKERIEKIEKFQIDEFEYKKNIREQNDKIRKLELKLKHINILKEYGWILGVFIIVVEILIELGKMLFS
ncbi:hypothetical protein K8354_16230 [Polaribacter litorisediminis]|uniref:hypothetical protein n=1 Tax=Polaribacter litorisediminis TaxID=1908341 RepID=UPI001CBE9152|nr:hypothetical protein [Polaribacter litorisediminis]UAM97818.1 hypothetical protein K8354_16230 [Polaribacter litorisediminis]